MNTTTSQISPRDHAPWSATQLVLGIGLLSPALLTWLFTLVLPTLRTLTMSFQDIQLVSSGPPEAVGTANYMRLFAGAAFTQALGFTLSLVATRLLVMAVVPLLLGVALAVWGRGLRRTTRVLFAIPLALAAPVTSTLVWRLNLLTIEPFRNIGFDLLASPSAAPSTVRWIDGVTTFGLACTIGLLVYNVALHGGDPLASAPRRRTRLLLVTWIVSLMATIALTLQTFALTYVLTGGGPGRSTTTLALMQYGEGFTNLRFGLAASIAMCIFCVAGALGLTTMLLLIGTRLRLRLAQATPPLSLHVGPRVVSALVLVPLLLGCLALAALAVTAALWAVRAVSYRPMSGLNTATLAVNTLVPPLIALLIQVPIAYLGATGIGVFRPFGRFSAWLLLPFSPWLFVTVVPLSLAMWSSYRELGILDSLPALVPPIFCHVPLLVVLTLLFLGQHRAFADARGRGMPVFAAWLRTMLLPSLPLVALIGSVTLLAEMRTLYWPLLVATSPEQYTFPLAALQTAGGFSTDYRMQAAAVGFELPLTLVGLVLFCVWQVFFADRFALVAVERVD